MKLAAEKNGYKIEFETNTKIFTVYDKEGDVAKETASDEALEKFLSGEEQGEKDKKSFKKIKAFQVGYGEWVSGIVTSVAEKRDKHQDCLVWFSREGGRRVKEYAQYFFIDNEQNRSQAKRIDNVREQIKGLQGQIEALIKEMVTVESVLLKKEVHG